MSQNPTDEKYKRDDPAIEVRELFDSLFKLNDKDLNNKINQIKIGLNLYIPLFNEFADKINDGLENESKEKKIIAFIMAIYFIENVRKLIP